jgi:8-oxo-dGTP pyrophosphatase MutT (NUDIX family)
VLCWDGREWSLPLTVRNALLSRHGGQVSLPGGLLDAGETPREAASRELGEELGQCPPLQWIGELSPLFVYASNAMVTTCVAAIDHWPAWTPQPAEVDRVLKLELRDLLDQPAAPPLGVERGPFRFRAPRLLVEGQSAWGATAVMLGELRGRLLRVSSSIVWILMNAMN